MGLVVLGYAVPAVATATLAGAAVVAALVQRFGGSAQPEPDNRNFGRGPYVSVDCTPNADLLARLGDLVRQLREVTLNEKVTVDRGPCDTWLAQAAAAAKAGKLADAARRHLMAIMSLMSQLREHRPASSDSSVFL
jgi:hypothetical protein